MATPEPIRNPQHRVARVTSRTGLGHDAGRSVGVNRVPPRERLDGFGDKEWLVEGVVEDVIATKTDYPYFVWDNTKSC